MTNSQKQHLLAYLGYYKIPVDGRWGPGSRRATTSFQSDYGLNPDGKFGPATEKRIKEVVGSDEKPQKPTPSPDSDISWDDIKHFKRSEFKCKCGGKYCNGFPVEPDMQMVKLIDTVREHFGVSITPHSAIRCEQHNKNVGGSSHSQHKLGKAVDFHVTGVPNTVVRDYVETLLPNTGGIGIYDWGVHMDTRKTKARWDLRTKK